MRVENHEFPKRDLPDPLIATLNTAERIWGSDPALKRALGDVPIILTSPAIVEEAQNGEFLRSNLLGRMASERGLDLNLFFKPNKVGAVINHENGEQAIYLSSEPFRPFYVFSRKNKGKDEYISFLSISAFAVLHDFLLGELPEEVQFEPDSDFVEMAESTISEHLHNRVSPDSFIEGFANEFKEFMISNRDNISYSAKGFTVNVKLGDQKIFDIFSEHNNLIRTMLTEHAIEAFKERMKKAKWFTPSRGIDLSLPHGSDQMNFVSKILEELNETSRTEVLEAYRTSLFGQLAARRKEDPIRIDIGQEVKLHPEDPRSFELEGGQDLYLIEEASVESQVSEEMDRAVETEEAPEASENDDFESLSLTDRYEEFEEWDSVSRETIPGRGRNGKKIRDRKRGGQIRRWNE